MADMVRQHISFKKEKCADIAYNNSVIVDNEMKIIELKDQRK